MLSSALLTCIGTASTLAQRLSSTPGAGPQRASRGATSSPPIVSGLKGVAQGLRRTRWGAKEAAGCRVAVRWRILANTLACPLALRRRSPWHTAGARSVRRAWVAWMHALDRGSLWGRALQGRIHPSRLALCCSLMNASDRAMPGRRAGGLPNSSPQPRQLGRPGRFLSGFTTCDSFPGGCCYSSANWPHPRGGTVSLCMRVWGVEGGGGAVVGLAAWAVRPPSPVRVRAAVVVVGQRGTIFAARSRNQGAAQLPRPLSGRSVMRRQSSLAAAGRTPPLVGQRAGSRRGDGAPLYRRGSRAPGWRAVASPWPRLRCAMSTCLRRLRMPSICHGGTRAEWPQPGRVALSCPASGGAGRRPLQ